MKEMGDAPIMWEEEYEIGRRKMREEREPIFF